MRKLPLILGGLLWAAPVLAQNAGGPPAAKPAEPTKPAEAPAPAKPTDAAKPEAPKPDPAKPAETDAAKASAASATTLPLPAPEAPKPTEAKPPVKLELTPPTALAATKPPNTLVFKPQATVSGPDLDDGDDKWKFEFHGYVRAPMRVGIGRRAPTNPRVSNPGFGCASPVAASCPINADQSKTTLHAPVLPDDQYLGWQHTNHNPRDWAEMFFSLGNSQARGTVSVQGYNFAESTYNDPTTQFGLGQAYVDLTPDLGYEDIRLSLRAGAFWNKYGQAGRYDGGEYDTYLFGRTHNAGETLHIDYDLDPENTIWFEHGIGAKKPDPSIYNNTRFTMLHHGHIGFNHGEDMKFSANLLDSWTQEEERPDSPANQAAGATIQNIPDGRMWVGGVDARFELGAFGYLYAGYSHIGLHNAITVGRAIEVLHGSGGGEFQLGVVDNYLGPSCTGDSNAPSQSPFNQDTTADGYGGCSRGSGTVDSLLGQYEFSLTNFNQQIDGGQRFWGEGADFTVVLYGMYNKVASDYKAYDGIHKLKYGTDLRYSALSWLMFGLRADRVQPNNRIPEQSFAIVSPRVVFRSKWNTHEAITFQYSHYFYNQRTCDNTGIINPGDYIYQVGQKLCAQPPTAPVPPDGFGAVQQNQTGMRGSATTRPDENVFNITATMWW
ncbi:MAG TPA: hypothetical protein VGI10_15730 [Polyangiaceae bacterium]|jgi:hypothetical protein